MTDFDPSAYLDQKVAILCVTPDEADEFLALLHSQGYAWRDGTSLLVENKWEDCEEETCYDISSKRLTYCDFNWFIGEEYFVLKWADIRKTEAIQLSNDEWANILAVAKASN